MVKFTLKFLVFSFNGEAPTLSFERMLCH